MKLPGFEGTSQEFADMITNHGFKPQQFLNTNTYKVHWLVLTMSVIAFAVLVFFLYITKSNQHLYVGLFICSVIFLAIICCMVHLKFKEGVVTSLVFFIGSVILGFSVGNLTPKEAVKKITEHKITTQG